MADVELVIKIPEETANAIKDNVMFGVIPSEILWDVTSAIVNGIPLPKGHGRLIDADKLLYELQFGQAEEDWYALYNSVEHDIKYSPTIIEADTAESEKQA